MKTMRIFVISALQLICLLAVTANAGAEAIAYIGVRPDTYLRSDESASQPYLARMPYGSRVTLYSENEVNGDLWSYIGYNRQYGFCKSKYIQSVDPCDGVTLRPSSLEEAFGGNLLQKGNKTPDYRVKNLQLCLIEGGYLDDAAQADGYFGKKTREALRHFQASNNLEPAGRAGDTTKQVLWRLYEAYLIENGLMP